MDTRKRNILTLAVKQEYFDDIKSGKKRYEFRLYNEFWQKRILHKNFDYVEITLGYPKKDDQSRRIKKAWIGYKVKEITHKEFGLDPVKVFAIALY